MSRSWSSPSSSLPRKMLLDLLDAAGVTAVAINGSMSLSERALAQEAFRERAQVLVSTDAGGEGINLQFRSRRRELGPSLVSEPS